MAPTLDDDSDSRSRHDAIGGSTCRPEAEQVALRAICDAFPEGQARFRSVEATGMGRNDYYDTAYLAIQAFNALRRLPVEQRMEAMGMEGAYPRHNGRWVLWQEADRSV